MTDQPKTLLDFEFHFLNGSKDYVTAEQDRDGIDLANPDAVCLKLHHADDIVEDVTVYRAALASLKVATRTVQPEPKPVTERYLEQVG